MGTLNVRLSEELASNLQREATLTHRPRSELAREAIREYLERRERERYLAEFVAEARAVYSDETLRSDARQIARDMDAVEADGLPSSTEEDTGGGWWR